MDDFGNLMRSELRRGGYTLRAACKAMYRDAAYPSRVMNGKAAPSRELAADLDALLGTSKFTAALDEARRAHTGPDPLRVAHEWLIDDVPALAGRESVAERVVELRRLDDTMPGGRLLPIVLEELDACRFPGVAAELYQLAGWIASDLGRRSYAADLYMTGVEAAREAGDTPLVGQLLSCLAYQDASRSRAREPLLLARTAARGVQGAAPPLVEALLGERVAWAAARVGEARLAERTLDTVDAAYERHLATGAESPDWTYWLNRTEIDVMAGRCLIELGKPAQAAPMLRRAIATYPAEHARETGLYLTWLAESYAGAGDRDTAEATLREAAAVDTDSDRIAQRLSVVRQAMPGQ